MRRRNSSLAANPVLIGGATVLLVIVAVFLSYNANNGLPFVPSYSLHVEVPNASGLVVNNEVRRGGARVGVVSEINTHVRTDGTATAMLTLKLDKRAGRIPIDTRVKVRPRSPLGLKYVELSAGRSPRTYPSGATMAMRPGAKRPVEFDDFFGMFDAPTRAASKRNLIEFGDAFAGRGGDLNEAIRGFEPLARHGERAARNLAAPATRLEHLFPAFEQAAHEVAPVARQQADLFGGLNTTFGALAGVADDLRASISGGPPALDTATRELPAQAPFITDTTRLFRSLRPAFASLASASPRLADAFTAGTPALQRSPSLNARLQKLLAEVQRFAADPRVMPALRRLTETANLLEPTLAFATPAQTTCNYFGLFFHNLASALSESDSVGSFLRFGIVAQPQQPGSEAGPAAVPADGPAGNDFSNIPDSFLHTNPYPNTAAPGQTKECEAGNETYTSERKVIGNLPGNQGTASEKTGNWKAQP